MVQATARGDTKKLLQLAVAIHKEQIDQQKDEINELKLLTCQRDLAKANALACCKASCTTWLTRASWLPISLPL